MVLVGLGHVVNMDPNLSEEPQDSRKQGMYGSSSVVNGGKLMTSGF